MSIKEQFTAILFADISGYSKVKDNNQKTILAEMIENIRTDVLKTYNHFYSNTWGDSILVCSLNTFDLSIIALKIRDIFKYQKWSELGFKTIPSIRIALHLSKINVKYFNKKVEDVFGKGLDHTARIEPIVKPNEVYCTRRVFEELIRANSKEIDANCIGQLELAKNYGSEELYKLIWKNEK